MGGGTRRGLAAMLGCAALAAATQPNVLVVVLDDLGFGDVGYNNPEMASATPTIDRLAAAGVKLDKQQNVAKPSGLSGPNFSKAFAKPNCAVVL